MKKLTKGMTDSEKKEVSLFDLEEQKKLRRKEQLKNAQKGFKKLSLTVKIEEYEIFKSEADARNIKITDLMRLKLFKEELSELQQVSFVEGISSLKEINEHLKANQTQIKTLEEYKQSLENDTEILRAAIYKSFLKDKSIFRILLDKLKGSK